MGSHKKHKYYKKKSKKSKKHKKQKINLKEVHDKLKIDNKYSDLISTLSIKDKRKSVEKRSRSESSDTSASLGAGRRKIKYKYKKSRSSSMTSSSSSSSSLVSSSSSSPSSSSSSSSDEKQRKAKHRKKKLKKDEKKKKIELLNRKHEENKKLKTDDCTGKKNNDDFNYDKKKIKKIKLSNDSSGPGPLLPDSLIEKSKAMAPMSKEEYERKQNEIRRVYDQETGRYRLIKGDGEVLEEIVSRSRHREINKQATAGDGAFFQSTITSKMRK